MIPVIEVKRLKKYFATRRGMLHAVDDVNLSIYEGQTLGVVGESGCGKSTFGRTVIHLLERTEGYIYYRGKDISDVKGKDLRKVRENMQIIFQDPYSSLDPRKTIEETSRPDTGSRCTARKRPARYRHALSRSRQNNRIPDENAQPPESFLGFRRIFV